MLLRGEAFLGLVFHIGRGRIIAHGPDAGLAGLQALVHLRRSDDFAVGGLQAERVFAILFPDNKFAHMIRFLSGFFLILTIFGKKNNILIDIFRKKHDKICFPSPIPDRWHPIQEAGTPFHPSLLSHGQVDMMYPPPMDTQHPVCIPL
jgi:hypothetical protein